MKQTRLVGSLLFLAFAADRDGAYAGHIGGPFGWVSTVLLDPTPVKIRLFDLLRLAILLTSGSKSKTPSVLPMRNALYVALGTTVLWFAYGLLRGGAARLGDMGMFSQRTMYTMAVSYAIALKMPRFAGVWDVQPAAMPVRSSGRGARSAWPSSSSYRSSS
jgi:hypothetical protein